MRTFKEIMNSKQSELTLGEGLMISLGISGIFMVPAIIMIIRGFYDDYEWKKAKTIDEVKKDD